MKLKYIKEFSKFTYLLISSRSHCKVCKLEFPELTADNWVFRSTFHHSGWAAAFTSLHLLANSIREGNLQNVSKCFVEVLNFHLRVTLVHVFVGVLSVFKKLCATNSIVSSFASGGASNLSQWCQSCVLTPAREPPPPRRRQKAPEVKVLV